VTRQHSGQEVSRSCMVDKVRENVKIIELVRFIATLYFI